MLGSRKNLLTYVGAHPAIREAINSLFNASYEIITYQPLKEYDDAYTMTVKNQAIQITFDFSKSISLTFVVSNKVFENRQLYLIDECSLVLKKGKNPLVLDREMRDGIALFLGELIFSYMKEVANILSGKEKEGVIKVSKEKTYALCREEFMNVVRADPTCEVLREIAQKSTRVFELIPEAKPYYEKWIQEKNKPCHEKIHQLMKSRSIRRFIRRKTYKWR